MLRIDGLSVSVLNDRILDGVSLDVSPSDVIALMGANGSGKSSLASAILGSQQYVVNEGKVVFAGKDLLAMSIDERSRAGILVAWQNPVAVPGLSVLSYLRGIYEAHGNKISTMVAFRDMVVGILERVGLDAGVIGRNLNDGFSGGEKKRFELVQLLLLQPKLAILDEIDSGLDVDGLRMVTGIVEELRSTGTAFILITHYKKLLDYVVVDKVVVLSKGKVTAQGGHELVQDIEKSGYAKYN
jgi:Fe-S cluster assembly ATP-binding protein